jgi:hypothetical protein
MKSELLTVFALNPSALTYCCSENRKDMSVRVLQGWIGVFEAFVRARSHFPHANSLD